MKNKIINDALVNGVTHVIEEASDYIANRLTNNHLLKEGKVTLNEAKYFEKLAREVLMEAAEELIPDEIEVPNGAQEVDQNGDNSTDLGGDIVLTDSNGVQYIYHPGTGELEQVSNDPKEESPIAPMDIPGDNDEAVTESEIIVGALLTSV